MATAITGEGKNALQLIATTTQVLSVVVGVVISVLSFNAAREKEAQARQLEAAKPFLTLRQNVYTEAVKAAAVLANPEVHTADELTAAKKRFRDLYVAELSMVETETVAAKMVALAAVIDPPLATLTPAQRAAYNLSHALRDTYIASWGLNEK